MIRATAGGFVGGQRRWRAAALRAIADRAWIRVNNAPARYHDLHARSRRRLIGAALRPRSTTVEPPGAGSAGHGASLLPQAPRAAASPRVQSQSGSSPSTCSTPPPRPPAAAWKGLSERTRRVAMHLRELGPRQMRQSWKPLRAPMTLSVTLPAGWPHGSHRPRSSHAAERLVTWCASHAHRAKPFRRPPRCPGRCGAWAACRPIRCAAPRVADRGHGGAAIASPATCAAGDTSGALHCRAPALEGDFFRCFMTSFPERGRTTPAEFAPAQGASALVEARRARQGRRGAGLRARGTGTCIRARGRRALRARQGDQLVRLARATPSTELLDGMHYRGLLRVARRDAGTRVYAARDPWPAVSDRAQTQWHAWTRWSTSIVAKYVPLAVGTLSQLGAALAATGRAAMGGRPRTRALAHARERASGHARDRWHRLVLAGRRDPASAPRACAGDRVRLLAPVRPGGLGPAAASSASGAGYTASERTRRRPSASSATTRWPLLWRERIVGWANVSVESGAMRIGSASSARG